jgi:hypothetical protein
VRSLDGRGIEAARLRVKIPGTSSAFLHPTPV